MIRTLILATALTGCTGAFAVGVRTLGDYKLEGSLGAVLDPTKVNTP